MLGINKHKANPELRPLKRRRWKLKRSWLIVGIPLFIFVYALAFFDFHLRRSIERFATQLNGAPVSIEKLRTHWSDLAIDIRGFHVANPSNASENLLEIDRIHFKLLFQALLRKKINIPQMNFEGVRYGTERLPTETYLPVEQPYGVKGVFERVSSGMYAQVRNQIGDNPLRHMATLMRGLDISTQVENSTRDLSSLKRVLELRAQFDETTGEWERTRAPAALSKLDTYVPEVEKSLREVDDLIAKDIERLRSRLRLPNLSKEDLTPVLLGPMILNYLERITYWVDLSRRRAVQGAGRSPSNSWRSKVQQGSSVAFQKLTSFPTFWIGEIMIKSSPEKHGNGKGIVNGQVTDITSDPFIVGKPLNFELSADFPDLGVRNLKAKGSIDHLSETPQERLQVSLEKFPVTHFLLTDTAELKFEIKKALGEFTSSTEFRENELKSQFAFQFSDVEYEANSNLKYLEKVLKTVAEPVRHFYINATAAGSFEKISFESASELGKSLAVGLRDEFKHSIGAIEDDLRKNILDKVHPERERLRLRIEKMKLAVNALNPTNASPERN